MRLVNIRPNFHMLEDDGPRKTTVWFSYETPVALQVGRGIMVVRKNVWGPTTGRHLNAIDGGGPLAKAERVDAETFTAHLEAAF